MVGLNFAGYRAYMGGIMDCAYECDLQLLAKSRHYAVVTCEIKSFQNYFSLRRRPTEIILPEIIF